ncbi:hypothetical protein [Nocardia sp. NPDC004722]
MTKLGRTQLLGSRRATHNSHVLHVIWVHRGFDAVVEIGAIVDRGVVVGSGGSHSGAGGFDFAERLLKLAPHLGPRGGEGLSAAVESARR